MALNKYDIQDAVGHWVVLISNDESTVDELTDFSVSCPTQIRKHPDNGKFVLTRQLTEQDIADENFCQYLISIWDTEARLQRFIDNSVHIS
mgnify:CR=1 FL=1